MRLQAFREGFKEVVSNKTTMSYLLCAGFALVDSLVIWVLLSNFMQFGKTGQEFSAYFAVLAGVMGVASFTNSKIVMKFASNLYLWLSRFVLNFFSFLRNSTFRCGCFILDVYALCLHFIFII